jgi:hypothetical protein
MRRLTSGALLAALTVSSSAYAGQAEEAAKANEDGKELMYGGKYAEATAKFREAVARVPEAKYFFNLCTSLFQEGKFSDALTACDAVEKNKPTADLQAKATKLIGRIEETAKEQKLTLVRGGGGGLPSDNQPPPPDCQGDQCGPPPPVQGQPPPVVGQAPKGPALFQAIKPNNRYLWTLGAEFFAGGGTIGRPDVYGTAAVGFRAKADWIFHPAQRFGTQLYIQFTQVTAGEEQMFGATNLSVVDFGVGVYKHLCPPSTERLCLTPFAGAHLALLSPEFDNVDGTAQFNYASVGARLEVSLDYAFGLRNEHVFSLKLGANFYSAVLAGPTAGNFDGLLTAQEAMLDQGGGFGYVGIGYTRRFQTPLGSRPFVTLE